MLAREWVLRGHYFLDPFLWIPGPGAISLSAMKTPGATPQTLRLLTGHAHCQFEGAAFEQVQLVNAAVPTNPGPG